jgi:hypothetical protein
VSYRNERVAAALTFIPRAVSRRIGLQQLILAYGFTDESAIAVRFSIEHAIGAAVLEMEMAAEMVP